MLHPGTTVGRYRIDRQLGRGGVGVVFLGHDPTLDRSVAIKVLTPLDGSRGRLLREARSASALNHPNICTVYEIGEDSGREFIAMEYIDGRPLRDVIDGAPVPLNDALQYAIAVADALAHAHDRKVVHGERIVDPSLQLLALDVLIDLEGDGPMVANARAIAERMKEALPDDTMKRRFEESSVVQRLRKA